MADSIDIGETVAEILLADPEVSAAVGQRVFSDHMPQSIQPPSIVYTIVSELVNECLEAAVGFDQARIQIDTYGDGRGDSVSLNKNVRDALAHYRGVQDGVSLQITQATGATYFFDRAEMGTDSHRYRTIQDFFVYYHSLAKVA